MDGIHCFPAKEVNNNVSATEDRFLIIAESYFLNFESIDKKKNTIKLLAWAYVQSIVNIKRGKNDKATLILTWYDKRQGHQMTTYQTIFSVD